MWSILTDALPEYISVEDSAIWRVNTDYRIWLCVGQLLSDFDSESLEAQRTLVEQIYKLIIPEGEKVHGTVIWANFVDAVSRFYAGPQKDRNAAESTEEPEESEPNKPKARRQFDFDYDAELIYQSFASFYNIRLCEVQMHWWEFLTLFNGLMLNDNNSLNFVVGIRQRKIGDVPKQQRAAYGKMKREFALPKPENVKEAENAVFAQLEAMWSDNGRESDHQN